MSSNASASDSAKINVVRNPVVYPEPVTLNAFGRFDCVIERAGGLLEKFSVQNTVLKYGKQALIHGIARSGTSYASTPKTGMYISLTAAPSDDTSEQDLTDFTTATTAAANGLSAATGSGTGDTELLTGQTARTIYLRGTGSQQLDIFGVTIGATAKTIDSSPIKVTCGSAGSGALRSIVLVDSSSAATSNKAFCAADITVTLASGDTLTSTYTLSIS